MAKREAQTKHERFRLLGALKNYERIELSQLRVQGYTVGAKKRTGRVSYATVLHGAIPLPQLPGEILPARRGATRGAPVAALWIC
jgi:hypothetical protein